jgi:hypothetical protein
MSTSRCHNRVSVGEMRVEVSGAGMIVLEAVAAPLFDGSRATAKPGPCGVIQLRAFHLPR